MNGAPFIAHVYPPPNAPHTGPLLLYFPELHVYEALMWRVREAIRPSVIARQFYRRARSISGNSQVPRARKEGAYERAQRAHVSRIGLMPLLRGGGVCVCVYFQPGRQRSEARACVAGGARRRRGAARWRGAAAKRKVAAGVRSQSVDSRGRRGRASVVVL